MGEPCLEGIVFSSRSGKAASSIFAALQQAFGSPALDTVIAEMETCPAMERSVQNVRPVAWSRRALIELVLVAAVGNLSLTSNARAERPLQFGLTPVFLTSDLELLTQLKAYLARKCKFEVQLVQRRTYEEITTLLISGQLDAAWICGYPFAQYRSELALVAVPVWRGEPLYESYIIVPAGRQVQGIEELRGDLHAFSDPNSNSGYLVTVSLLAERRIRPEEFFKKTIFTYGHRNVVRAVASGLAQSGSVDGYVWAFDATAMGAEPSDAAPRSRWLS